MIFKDKFLKNNILMFFSTSLASVANLLYQLVVVRQLSVSGYGAFNSLLAVLTILSFPLSAFTTMVAKYIPAYVNTGEKKKADLFLSALFKQMLVIGLVLFGLYLLFGGAFKDYLHLDSVAPVYFTGAMLFATMIAMVTIGGLQGHENFLWYSISSITQAVLKLALAFWFIKLGFDLLGALGGYLVAQIAALAVSIVVLRKALFARGSLADIQLAEKYKFMLPSIATFICIAVLTNVDVVLVKHFFEPVNAGYYSVAQLMGRIALFVPGAVYVVMFPSTAGMKAQNKDPRVLLKRSLKYAAILCGLVIAVYNLFPGFILNLLTGKSSDTVIFLGRLFTVAMSFFALTIVLLLYQLSVSKFRFLKSLIPFSLLHVAAISLFHASLGGVLAVLVINSVILFILNFRSAMTE